MCRWHVHCWHSTMAGFPLTLGVEGNWSTCPMACGRRHDDLTAASIVLGYMDCRVIAMSIDGPI